MPAVAIAIVSYNTRLLLDECLRSLRPDADADRAEVWVVDNNSTDGSADMVEAEHPWVTLVRSGENLGYGTAANRALRGGGGELVCVSNADVLPEPGALAALAAVALAEPDAGMVGPAFGGDTDRYHAELPNGAAMLGRIFVGSFARGAVAAPGPGEVVEVGQPSGACFVVRRETWERIGGFDEGFFLWYEDVDLARRLRDAGFRNLVAGSARVGHAGAGAFVQVDKRRQQAIRLRSVERYIRLHHGRAAPLAAPLLRLSARLRAGGASTRPSG